MFQEKTFHRVAHVSYQQDIACFLQRNSVTVSMTVALVCCRERSEHSGLIRHVSQENVDLLFTLDFALPPGHPLSSARLLWARWRLAGGLTSSLVRSSARSLVGRSVARSLGPLGGREAQW